VSLTCAFSLANVVVASICADRLTKVYSTIPGVTHTSAVDISSQLYYLIFLK
jgi:hypothetical protein